jgi:hypothetical protein
VPSSCWRLMCNRPSPSSWRAAQRADVHRAHAASPDQIREQGLEG